MKKPIILAIVAIGSLMMVSCQSEKKQKLIGIWEATYSTTGKKASDDYQCTCVEKDTYKDNGDSYGQGTLTYKYNFEGVDYTIIVENSYSFSLKGTWSISGDEVALTRNSSDFNLESTESHIYETATGEEVVLDTDHKNEVMKRTERYMDDTLKEMMDAMKEPDTLTIVSIADKEMQMEGKYGIITYNRPR